jgi:hypothetical protein
VPADWDDFVRRCLAREPHRRFASVRAALAALPHLRTEPRRTRLRPLLVGLGVVLTVSAGVVLLRPTPPSEAPVSVPQSAPPERKVVQPIPVRPTLEAPRAKPVSAPAVQPPAIQPPPDERKPPRARRAREAPAAPPSAAPRTAPSLDALIDPFE